MSETFLCGFFVSIKLLKRENQQECTYQAHRKKHGKIYVDFVKVSL